MGVTGQPVSLVGAGHWLTGTRISYDTVAVRYASQLRGALDEKPCIRFALALFTTLVHAVGGGPVADVDCGPGRVLHTCTTRVFTPSASAFRP